MEVNEWMNGWMNTWTDVWMDGWMHVWMNEWMNEWINECNQWTYECRNSIVLAGHSGKLLSTSSTPVGVQRWGSTCPESIGFLKEFLKEFDLGLVQLRSHLAQCRPVQSSSALYWHCTAVGCTGTALEHYLTNFLNIWRVLKVVAGIAGNIKFDSSSANALQTRAGSTSACERSIL